MKIAANGAIRGLVGNLVARKIGNQQILQSRPRKAKQTVATKKASIDFGQASNAGGFVRSALSDTHLNLYDSHMVGRLNGQILRAMRANPDQIPGKMSLQHGKLNRLANFQFNEKSNTQDYLNFDIELSLHENNLLTIDIPKFKKDRDITFLDAAGKMIVVINAMAIDFVKAEYHIVSYTEIEINCAQLEGWREAERIEVDCTPVMGCVTFVGLSVLYFNNSRGRDILINSKALHPASIVGAFNIA